MELRTSRLRNTYLGDPLARDDRLQHAAGLVHALLCKEGRKEGRKEGKVVYQLLAQAGQQLRNSGLCSLCAGVSAEGKAHLRVSHHNEGNSNSSGVYTCKSIVNYLRHGNYICKSEAIHLRVSQHDEGDML